MDNANDDLDGSPPWVRLAWTGLCTLIANGEARNLMDEAPIQAMARGLLMSIAPHLGGDRDTADLGLSALIDAGIGDLTLFHCWATSMPSGFCQIAVIDSRDNLLLGEAALDVMARCCGPGLMPFYRVDLRQLRLSICAGGCRAIGIPTAIANSLRLIAQFPM
jgi:hypothetical protein